MRFLIQIAMLTCPFLLLGQTAHTEWYTVANGLPSTEVTNVYNDSNGLLWISCQNGWISSFDGQQFTSYSPSTTGIYFRYYNFHDTDSGLWAYAPTHGVALFRDEVWHPIANPYNIQAYVPYSDAIIGINGKGDVYKCIDTTWHYWTSLKIPDHLINGKELYWHANHDHSSFVLIINNQPNKYCFLVTDWENGTLTPIETNSRSLTPLDDHSGILTTDAQKLVKMEWDDEGQIISSKILISNSALNVIDNNPLIIPEYNQGEVKFYEMSLTGKKSFVFKIESSYTISKMTIDDHGRYWMATQGGLLKVDTGKLSLFEDNEGMVSGLHVIIEDNDGRIWFGGYNDGFSFLEDSVLKKLHYEKIKVLPGSFLDIDGKCLIWMEFKGLSSLSIEGLDHSIYDEPMRDGHPLRGYFLKEISDGRLALGTMKYGLMITSLPLEKNSPRTFVHKEKGLLLDNVLCISEDKSGRLWVGRSSQGLAVYDPALDTANTWLITQEEPASFGAMSMESDYKGNLWLGTNKGLFFLKDPHKLEILSESVFDKAVKVETSPMGSSLVTFLKHHEKFLFFGNLHGHGYVDLESFYENPSHPRIRFENTTSRSLGGASEQNAVLIDSKDRLWIGKDRGALCIDWRDWTKDHASIELELRRIMCGDSLIPSKDMNSIQLPKNHRNISIQVGHQFNGKIEDRVSYVYALIYNDDTTRWKSVNNKTISLLDLKPGEHQVLMKAVVDNQIKDQKSLHVSVPYRIGEHPLFLWMIFGIGVLFLVSIGYLTWRNRMTEIRSIKAKSRLQAQLDLMKTQLITSSLNPHFINNSLHWLQSQLLENPKAVQVAGRLSENIRTIFQYTRTGINHHSLTSELKLVENYLLIQKARYGEEIDYHLPDHQDWSEWSGVHIPIMQIQIHVENAIEHGLRNKSHAGNVWVKIQSKFDHIQIQIEDDGVGRENARAMGSSGTQQGTKMLRELHELLNKHNHNKIKSFYIDHPFTDSLGNEFGTRVEIQLPKLFKYDFSNS